MLVKTILIFLLAMALVGMVGKLLFPNSLPGLGRRKGAFCPDCGRPRIGRGTCDCRGRK
ncbi:hypothetical protein [Pseudogemmobacter blasticus]|uniref:hypothetical protein n=1 Tax=Fuscovulum blasticum TaxID=1075 RepID=UPI0015E6CA2A|nr:hypothetical protein [Fuscovulum blasticum]